MLCALPAAAQENPRVEIFGGYSFARLETASPNRSNLHGWNAAIQGNVTSWLGLVGDLSGHYGTRDIAPGVTQDINTHTFLFGPRVSFPAKVRPFAHALFGVARGNAGLFGSTDSESAFGMALGGGIDVEASRHVSIRLIQGDYLLNRFLDRNRNNWRLAAGLVFRFGK
jgi:opacity protein-like surface antigen